MRSRLNTSDRGRRVIHCSSFCFGAAPTWREASSPFLNIISVGIDMMPYFAAVAGFSSTLSLTILTLPSSAPAISSSAGAIIWHGPHHSAQKSTTTGLGRLQAPRPRNSRRTPCRRPWGTSFSNSGDWACDPWRAGTYGRRAGASRRLTAVVTLASACDPAQSAGSSISCRPVGPDQRGAHRPVRDRAACSTAR